MSDIKAPATTTYCTLYRIGHWTSLDAKCETLPEAHGLAGLTTHYVTYALIGKHGQTMQLGFSIFTGQSDEAAIWDEDGDLFPHLDAGIRSHADELVQSIPMPGKRISHPPRHETWDGSIQSAFMERLPPWRRGNA